MPGDIIFLNQGESFVTSGIECGLHGHNGINGARGGPQQFKRLSSKVNGAHGHSRASPTDIFRPA